MQIFGQPDFMPEQTAVQHTVQDIAQQPVHAEIRHETPKEDAAKQALLSIGEIFGYKLTLAVVLVGGGFMLWKAAMKWLPRG